MPVGADVVVPEEEVEPEDDVVEPVVVPVPVDVVVVPVEVEAPVEVPVVVELGVLGVVDEAGFVTCCEVPAVGELPPLAFPPQLKVAIRIISRKQPASIGEKERYMNTSRL
jgi:hypothetical protein